MSTSEKRNETRFPAVLRVRLKYPDVETFIERFAHNISRGGLFISSRTQKPVGTEVRFELNLANGEPVIRGEGRVAWIKEYDPEAPACAHGMGIRFTRLSPGSRSVLKRCLEWKARNPSADATPVEPVDEAAIEPSAQVSVESTAEPAPRESAAARELDTLLGELKLDPLRLSAALQRLRGEWGNAASADALERLLEKDPPVVASFDEATAGLARFCGSGPVHVAATRRGMAPPLMPADIEEVAAPAPEPRMPTPAPLEEPPLAPVPPVVHELEEIAAPIAVEMESATAPHALVPDFGAADDDEEPTRVAAARDADYTISEEVSEIRPLPQAEVPDPSEDELGEILAEIASGRDHDTVVDARAQRLLADYRPVEEDAAPPPVDSERDAAASLPLPVAEPAPPVERRRSFFKKLFGK